MGGSSKKVTVGYKYYLGMHMILCHGPVDRLLNITVDGRLAWTGGSTGGRINVQAANLFGGEKREGGVHGAVDLEMGLPAQGRNDYLQSRLGSDIPAHRGVVGVVLRQCYLGLNPYLKKWAFRLSRTLVRQDGRPQWYGEKAQIVVLPEKVFIDDLKFPATSASTGPYAGVTIDSGFTAEDVLIVSKPRGLTYKAWSYWTSDSDPQAEGLPWTNAFWVTSDNGTKLYWGGELDEAGKVTNRYATMEEADSAHAGDYVYLTGSTSYTFWIFDEPVHDNRGGLSLRVWKGGHIDMNPAHIIRECLTDPDWGMGYPESDIDDASFQAAADQLYDEAMGISILWDRQVPLESFIQEIIKHIDGALYVSRSTGKFVLKLIRSDYDENTLLELDPSNVEKIDNPARPTFGELTNSVTVNYWDSATGKDASVTVQDTAMIQMQGAVINTTVQYPGFTNFNIASRVAQRDLRALSSALLTCTIYANQDAKGLNIGDVFKLTWPDFEIDGLVMRVVGLAFGDGKSNKVRITAAQDVFALPETGVVTSQPPVWEDPSIVPTPAEVRVVVEAPYYELVQRMGQTSADELLNSSPETGYLLASARRPPGAINASLMVDAGAGYEDSGVVEFCPAAELSAPVGKLDTTLPITNADALEEVRIGAHLQLGEELVRVDAVGEDSITVGRGVLDTVPAEHLPGTPLLAWDDYAEGDQVEYLDGETLNVRLLPVSGAGEVELSAAATDTLTMRSRAARPYPPGDFKINGEHFPEEVPMDQPVVLTWAHRDRVQQTGGELIDFLGGDIGPEQGVSYTVRVTALFPEDPPLQIYEEGGIPGNTHTVDLQLVTIPPTAISLLLEVASERGGLESMWAQSHEIWILQAPYNLKAVWTEE